MKKILCLIDNLGSGGAQRQLVNIAVLLKNEGYEVEFVTYNDNNFFKYVLDEADISLNYIESPTTLKRITRVTKYLKKSDADVVIAFLETPGFLACLAKSKKVKWKLLTSELSAMKRTFQGKRQAVYNWFERRTDLKVCNSYNAKNMWEEHFPRYAPKLRVIYNPVMMQDQGEPKNKSEDGKLHIVVAASYQKIKNPLGVIEAVSMLDDDVKSRLKIDWYGRVEVTSGNTEIYQEAIKQVSQRGIGDIIELHRDTNEIYSIMNDADAVGLFSTVEGLPNAICEGMMLGKPIIMSKVSDYDILTDGNGVLCDDTDAKSISEALTRMVNLSKDELKKMGEVSKEKAERLFSKEAIIKQWMELIG